MKPQLAVDLPQLLQSLRLVKEQADSEGLTLLLVNSPSRTFRANLVTRVRKLPEDAPEYLVVEIHFSGLYGGMGVLPDYFTDAIIENRAATNGLRDFLDIFNHRFFDTLYEIWRHQQVFLENLLRTDHQKSLRYDRFVRALGGLPDDQSERTSLRCMSRYHLALLQRQPKTKRGLLYLLKSYFPELAFDMDEHVGQILDIPQHQRARLSPDQRPVLGSKGSFLIGSRILDINGKVRLNVAELDYETYMRFLPGGEAHEQLCTLVTMYTESQWVVGLRLELRAPDVPKAQLSGTCRLGANGWLLSNPSPENVSVEFGKLAV